MTDKAKDKTLSQKLQEMGTLDEIEKLIQDNTIEFTYNETRYRVRKPTYEETEKLNYERMKKYNEMMLDDNYKLEEQWIKDYKAKGIDINKMDTQLIENQTKEHELLRKIAKQKIESEVEKLKERVLELRLTKEELLTKKSELLQFSIETQITNYVNECLCALVFEKKEDKEWVKVFKTHKDLLKSNDQDLIIRGMGYLGILIYK